MIERIYTQLLLDMLDLFPIVAVSGPRQVGKSTLALSEPISKDRHYITLDDLASRALAQKDPISLLEQKGPITIDEIQMVPELFEEGLS